MIRVLAIESCEKSKEALGSVLENISDMELAQKTSVAEDALKSLLDHKIDVVVIDFGLSDMDTVELTGQIREKFPKEKILIYTDSEAPHDIFRIMDAGADGYLLKENLTTALEIAIRSIRLGQVWLDPQIARQVLKAIEESSTMKKEGRVLPTGLLTLPLMPGEKDKLSQVADSHCADGVCMVDPEFIKKLKRFGKT